MLRDHSEFIRCAHCGEKIPKPWKNCHVFCPECGEELIPDNEHNDLLDDHDDPTDYTYDRDDEVYDPHDHREREDWE